MARFWLAPFWLAPVAGPAYQRVAGVTCTGDRLARVLVRRRCVAPPPRSPGEPGGSRPKE